MESNRFAGRLVGSAAFILHLLPMVLVVEAKDLVLVDKGRPLATIVMADAPAENTRQAASALVSTSRNRIGSVRPGIPARPPCATCDIGGAAASAI